MVAAGALLALLLLYTLLGAYLPARQRAARLEAELRGLYAREAELQTRIAQLEQRRGKRERQLQEERDALARKLEDAQRELTAAQRRR